MGIGQVTIRRAIASDIGHLMVMARKEHERSRFSHIPFDDVKSEQSFKSAIDGLATAVFVSPSGFIAGMVQPMLFCKFWNAYELAWFSEDGTGLELLKAFTQWAKDMRAIDLIVHNYAGMVPSSRFNKVMKRKGFDTLGAAYMKTLGAI